MNFELPRRHSLATASLPRWDWEVYRPILHSLITGRVSTDASLETLRSQIIQHLGVSDALLCGSGSLALEIALRACDVGAGDEVVLPSFCCTAVVPPIVALGATAVLADVGADLNVTAETVQDALTQKTKAVIVPHLFGNPAEIERISELVTTRKMRLIDDAAQALGATIDGTPIGSFGDAGVLSFGAEKICSGIGGGVVVTRDGEIAAKFSQTKVSTSRSWSTLKQLLSQILRCRMRSWTERIRSDSTPDELPIPYRREQMSHLAAAVAARLMQTLEENIATRRVRVQAYRSLLYDCSGIELIPHRDGSACLTQVIRVVSRRKEDDPAARLVTVLRRAGCDVRGSYVPIHLLRSFGQCVWDRLPNTDRIWADLIELPCNPNVRWEDMERIAGLIRRAT